MRKPPKCNPTPAERAWLSQYEPATWGAMLWKLRNEPDTLADMALVSAIQREIDEAVAAYAVAAKEGSAA